METKTHTFEIEYAGFLFCIEVDFGIDTESDEAPFVDKETIKKITITSETNKSVIFDGDLLSLDPLERFIPFSIYSQAKASAERNALEDFVACATERRSMSLAEAHGVD